MENTRPKAPVKIGRVTLYFDETGAVDRGVLDLCGERPVLIAANRLDLITLYEVLCYTFSDRHEPGLLRQILDSGRQKGSLWSHIMRASDRPELFWLCAGPLSVWVLTDEMRELLADLKRVDISRNFFGPPGI